MSWWETLHLVTWWKRLAISAIKTGQDAPSWIWCTERLSFFWGGHIVLQRFVHVRCHFQPLPTKLVFAYFDRGSHEHAAILNTLRHEEHWQVGQSSLKRTFGEIAALFKQVTQPLGLSRPVSSSAPGGHWTFTTWASFQKKFCHVHDLMLEAASQQWYTWLGTSNF